MTRIQRLFSFISGIVSFCFAIALMTSEDKGPSKVMTVIGIGLTAVGVRTILYYFTMARFMVGGRLSLYKGIITADLGLITISVIDTLPNTYMIIYLVVVHGFAGLIELLRAIESIEYGNKRWKMKMTHGIVDLGMAALCLILVRDIGIAVTVYCIGLVYSAVLRVISAFSKTTIVYIQ